MPGYRGPEIPEGPGNPEEPRDAGIPRAGDSGESGGSGDSGGRGCFGIPADEDLFLDGIFVEQENHDDHYGCWEEGEERPDHIAHGLIIGNGDDRLPCGIGARDEACHSEEKGYERP